VFASTPTCAASGPKRTVAFPFAIMKVMKFAIRLLPGAAGPEILKATANPTILVATSPKLHLRIDPSLPSGSTRTGV
jgi:hypothetical protein